MKCIIMAAGVGLRFSDPTSGQSKTTLPILGGVPLLRHTVDTLRRLGLGDVIVVVGYDYENVIESLRDTDVTIIENRKYHDTNSIVSASTCMPYFDGSDDLLMMNGDSYYETSLVRSVIDDPGSPILLVDRARRQCADVKVLIQDGIVTRYEKELSEPPDAESADLVKLSAGHARTYGHTLREMMAEGSFDCYWEDVLFRMNPVRIIAKDTCGHFWADIDRLEDYERILSHVSS